MSIIFKSDVLYTGDKKLQSITKVSYTPDEFYELYKSRVVDDGGEIVNPAKTKSMISFLFEQDLFGSSHTLVSPFFGIKKSGNFVTKLYALDGLDLEGKLFGSGKLATIASDGGLQPDPSNGRTTNTGCIYTSNTDTYLMPKGVCALVSLTATDTSDTYRSATIGLSRGWDNEYEKHNFITDVKINLDHKTPFV